MTLSVRPITDVQKGLVYLQQINPQTAAYNVVFAAKIEGEFDFDSLQAAFYHLQQQHLVLRELFAEENGELIAREQSTLKLDIRREDIASLSPEQAHAHIYAASRVAFNLYQDLCLRVELFRLSESETVMTLVAHHANFDFWSLALLLEQLAGHYQALSAGDSLALDSEAIQFDQYVDHLQALQQKDKYQAAREELLAGLRGSDGVLNLSTDHSRSRLNPMSGTSYSFAIPADLTAAVHETAKAHKVTPYMYLLSAFQLALHRYSGQDDLLVGTPAAGRDKRKWNGVMGNFVNTLVLRSQVDETSDFAQMLANTYQRVVTSVRHQSVQFPQLVEGLGLKRDSSRTPLIQASFAWDRLPQFADMAHFFSHSDCSATVEWGGLNLSPYWIPQQEGQFDLALEMGAEIAGELTATLKFRDDLFEAESAACFAANFVELLGQVTADPQQNIHQVKLVDAEQQQRILGLADSDIPVSPAVNTVHGLFQQQAGETPDAIAVRDPDGAMSYQQLETESSRIAALLQSEYKVAGKRVAICHQRNRYLLVNLLAIFKAGASYVPIDPNVPAARSQMIIEDGDLSLLIQDEAINHLDFSAELPVVGARMLGIAAAAAESLPAAQPAAQVSGDDIAYMIFTSGSTGRPKGVSVPHGCVVNLLSSFAQYPGIRQQQSLLAVTTISFDISVLELFLPITHGGETIIIGSDASADPQQLIAYMEQFRPQIMQATPSHWRMLLEAGWQGDQALTVYCGGEALPRSLAEQLLENCADLYNVYGPTETTIWSTIEHYRGGDVSIGRPIANTQVYVVDSNHQIVPQGVVGELCIGGDGVTQGYFEKPQLTADAFIEADFVTGTIYKTGDQARINSRGKLECLGRIGNQVKIRGFRIELDDIEENLRKIDGISNAVVAAKAQADDKVLVCYYVAEGESAVESKAIREQLKAALPAYMVPNLFQPMAQLPMTANGKVDRKQLPEPQAQQSDRELMAPRGELESRLLSLWQQVLKQELISIEDDFYDIGGHSLLAVQLTGRINQQLGLELDNQFLLSNTTIAAMAAAIESGETDNAHPTLVTLNKGDSSRTPLFLMHPIGGTVYCYMALAQAMDKQQPLYAFQSPGIEEAEEAEVGIEEISRHYVRVIQEVQPEGPILLGGWCFGGVLAYEATRQLQAAGREVAQIYSFDTRAPIVANHPDDGDDATLLSWFARDLAVPHNKTLHIPPEELREIEVDEQFEYVLERAKAIGVIDADADEEKLLNYFSVYIANGMALQMYEEHSVDVPLTLYFARDETVDYGPLLGWDQLLQQGLCKVDIAGDHNSIMYKPQVQQIADDLSCRLNDYHFQTTAEVVTEEVA
ncbi:non-ribosomal peptide synthetase [Marinobacterium jannaschii]|uniref:non-ribosomal peptide synthetase n=1 Tax=Marinobacterium jannaschii TaxID=64970 RepID=UPI0006843102|nr:non-ribosomal peptide synthetase [Marinobacterium jannaschii]